MNLRLNLILLIIVAALGGWLYSQQEPENNPLDGLIKKEGEADYIGNRMNTTVFDMNGKPQYYAQADEIKRYQSSERTEFFKPMVNLFDQDTGKKAWQAQADYGEITKEKILNLKGNVELNALDVTSRLQHIEVDRLSVDLNTQDIWTESEVKSKGLGLASTGTGLKGNLKQQVANILHNVKTYIEPTVIQNSNKQNSNKSE